MERHIKEIKKILQMPNLKIYYCDSQKEKGIQVADAIAGSISRELFPRSNESYFKIIKSLMEKDIKKINIK